VELAGSGALFFATAFGAAFFGAGAGADLLEGATAFF
jgi:hypothetical protein